MAERPETRPLSSGLAMSSLDFDTVVKQEEAYLRKVHPTPEDIPSCTTLFDNYLQSNRAGPTRFTHRTDTNQQAVTAAQVKSLFRYGQRTPCAYKFEDFKFCLSNKAMHPQEKYEAWIRRRAEWWARRRMSKSSEEVWEIRT